MRPTYGAWLATSVTWRSAARREDTWQRTARTKPAAGVGGWRALVFASLLLAVAGCGSNTDNADQPPASGGKVDTVLEMPSLEGQEIVVNTFGGSFGDAVTETIVEPFEAATGAKVTVTTNCCDGFETQVKAGQFAGDVMFGAEYAAMKLYSDDGLLKSEPRLAQIAEARGVDPDLYQDTAIAHHFYGYVLAWNTEHADDHPSTWTEFFDTSSYEGTRSLSNYGFGALEIALLSSGVPASDLYPLDVDKGFEALTALLDGSPVQFATDGADSINKLATGEVDYALAFSNRVFAGIQQGLPLDMTMDQALLVADGVGIPATAKNVDGAVAFVDFAMAPSVQAAFAEAGGLAPAYPDAAEMVDPSLQKYMATSPENIDSVIPVDNDWWQENGASAEDRFTQWKTGS